MLFFIFFFNFVYYHEVLQNGSLHLHALPCPKTIAMKKNLTTSSTEEHTVWVPLQSVQGLVKLWGKKSE